MRALIEMIGGPDPAEDRGEAANYLVFFPEEIAGEHREAATGALRSAVQDPSAEVRSQALFALGDLRLDGAEDDLIRALSDPDWGVRMFAAAILGRFQSARAIERLGAALRDDPEGMVREAAASSLGDCGDPAALDALRRAAAEDLDREVRKAARAAVKLIER